MSARPEYLLFTEALRHPSGRYLWRFVLLQPGSDQAVTASELADEPSASRSELLGLVRGLEAIDQPSDVKLFTSSRYLRRGLVRGLQQWRRQQWHWERFGRRVPIRDSDLWQRVDHALDFHHVDCRAWGDVDTSDSHLAYEATPAMGEQTALAAAAEAPAVLVVPKRPRRARRPQARPARQALRGVGRHVTSLFDPALAPAG